MPIHGNKGREHDQDPHHLNRSNWVSPIQPGIQDADNNGSKERNNTLKRIRSPARSLDHSQIVKEKNKSIYTPQQDCCDGQR